jgi:hypothetical protein
MRITVSSRSSREKQKIRRPHADREQPAPRPGRIPNTIQSKGLYQQRNTY